VENQQCDICAQIAPLATTRRDMMHALRNFIHKPPPVPSEEVVSLEVQEEEMSSESQDVIELQADEQRDTTTPSPQEKTTPQVAVNNNPVNNNLFEDLDMEMPQSEIRQHEETTPDFEEEILDSQAEGEGCAELVTPEKKHDCFNETLLTSLADGRVRGRVVGRKELTDHVEFIYKIQVCWMN
jgi:hypothetical protein